MKLVVLITLAEVKEKSYILNYSVLATCQQYYMATFLVVRAAVRVFSWIRIQ